jgi:hypothetical protein
MRRTKAVWFIHLPLRRLYLLCLRCSLYTYFVAVERWGIQKLSDVNATDFEVKNVGRIFSVTVLCQVIYVLKLHWETVPLVWFCFNVILTFCVTVCNNIFIGWKCVHTRIRILAFLVAATAQVLVGGFK